MYVIVRNIFRFSPLLMNLQCEDEYEEAWESMPLSDIAELGHTHSVSGDNKGIEHLE